MPRRPPSRLLLRAALLASALVTGSAASMAAHGQQQGRVTGMVREGADGPAIAGAEVLLSGPVRRTAVTDTTGRFVVDALPPGSYTLRVSHIAFRAIETEFEIVGDGRTTAVEVRLLPDAIALDPVTVEVQRPTRPTDGVLGTVYDRVEHQQRLGLGVFMTRVEIDERVGSRASSLIGGLRGVRLIPHPHRQGQYLIAVGLATGSELPVVQGRTYCAPMFLLDGQQIVWRGSHPRHVPQETLDDYVGARDIEVVEVYRGGAQVPAEFSGSNARCGVIAVWTRRGH